MNLAPPSDPLPVSRLDPQPSLVQRYLRHGIAAAGLTFHFGDSGEILRNEELRHGSWPALGPLWRMTEAVR